LGELAVNDVVLVMFPFSNLKGQKLRPALVVANAEFDDLILCQITSKRYSSEIAVELNSHDFIAGTLPISSYIRPDKLFTADRAIISRKAGTVSDEKAKKVVKIIRSLFD
jgi:mRNA interferase MazF